VVYNKDWLVLKMLVRTDLKITKLMRRSDDLIPLITALFFNYITSFQPNLLFAQYFVRLQLLQ